MSDLRDAMAIASSGMRAQTFRLKAVSQNIANADTTGTKPGEDPYRRQLTSFQSYVDRSTGATMVKTPKIIYDQSDFKLHFDPQHPAADANGYVKMPNVNPLIEQADMQQATRSYEAALGAYDMARNMQNSTVDLLKN